MILTFIHGHNSMKNKTLLCPFLKYFMVDSDNIQYVATICWYVLIQFMLNIFCTSNIQGTELCWCDVKKYTIDIVLCQDACELICFKLGIMLDTAKLYI